MNFFTQLTAWQVFGLLVGIPVLLISGIFILSPSDLLPDYLFRSFSWIALCSIMPLYAWYFWAGERLIKSRSGISYLKVKAFRIFLGLSFIAALTIGLSIPYLIERVVNFKMEVDDFLILVSVGFLISSVSGFYGLIFIAGELASFQLSKSVKLNSFKLAVLLWFYPIGVWVIHPQLKIAGNMQSENDRGNESGN